MPLLEAYYHNPVYNTNTAVFSRDVDLSQFYPSDSDFFGYGSTQNNVLIINIKVKKISKIFFCNLMDPKLWYFRNIIVNIALDLLEDLVRFMEHSHS